MEYTSILERIEQFLFDNNVCTEEELALVTAVAGRTERILLNILKVRCGFDSLEAAAENRFIMDAVLQDLDKSMLSDYILDELGLAENTND